MIIFKILVILLSIVVSWIIAYSITMVSFWIDLNINNPNSEQMTYMKSHHLKMNKFVWLFTLIIIIVCVFTIDK